MLRHLALGTAFCATAFTALTALTALTVIATNDDELHRIKNVVLLVLENRSFDHIFGYVDLPGADNLLNKPPFSNLVNVSDPTSTRVFTSMNAPFVSPLNPGHGAESIKEQVFGLGPEQNVTYPYPRPNMQGFLQMNLRDAEGNVNIASTVMQGFHPEDIPATVMLAKEFAVFDRYFASVPGPTQPNRAYFHSATSNGESGTNKWHMTLGFPQRTIYDAFNDVGQDWRVYFHDAPTVGLFRTLRRPKNLLRMRPWKHFWQDSLSGTLPAFSFLEPRYFDYFGKEFANDDHPPHDTRHGQQLVKDVYDTLRLSPQWNSTLLLITYDEHGGYFDHVPTPVDDVPNPDGKMGEDLSFDRLGVRVPLIAVSPWIRKGTIVHEPGQHGPTPSSQYEHSSVPATLKKLFRFPSFLTKRDAWAGTFEHLWSGPDALKEPRVDCPRYLPRAPPIATDTLRRRDVSDTSFPDERRGHLTDMQRTLVMVVRALTRDTSDLDGDMIGGEGEDGVRNMTVTEAAQYVRQGIRTIYRGLGASAAELD